MILKTIKSNGGWFTYGSGLEVKMKPYSFLEEFDEETDLILDQFMACVIDWRGLVDEEGKVVKCIKEKKLYIYKFDIKFRVWVMNRITEIGTVFEEEVKNLEPSPNGITRKEA